MTTILDLSNETLIQIASYFSPSKPILTDAPFFLWPYAFRNQIITSQRQRSQISHLVRAHNRFRHALSPLLYSIIDIQHLALLEDSLFYGFENHPPFAADVTCVQLRSGRASDFRQLFWLPNIHTLCIHHFSDGIAFQWSDAHRVGTSTVKVLHLSKCHAMEAAVADVLSWPAGLKELWYDSDQDKFLEGGEPVQFSGVAVERAISSQTSTLEKLVISRDPFRHNPRELELLPLRGYPKLKSLCVRLDFLVSLDLQTECWRNLPESLEELEVYYQKPELNFTFLYDSAPQLPGWLSGLLEHKNEFVPDLKRIRITSDDLFDVNYSMDQTTPWAPPLHISEAFRRANVSLGIQLHENMKFSLLVDGGEGFQNNWEDGFVDLDED